MALVRKKTWVVYAKPPFAGPAAVLAYLSRYTHRVAISNRRLIALDDTGVTFRFKDYRRDGAERYGTMTLATGEFIRRFLLHALPRGFHRIRHYGLLASGGRRDNLARARELLAAPPPLAEPNATFELSDSPPAVSLLWRPHDHHRDLHALHPAAGATWAAPISRENDVVTRHGPIHPAKSQPYCGQRYRLPPTLQKPCGTPSIDAKDAKSLVSGLIQTRVPDRI